MEVLILHGADYSVSHVVKNIIFRLHYEMCHICYQACKVQTKSEFSATIPSRPKTKCQGPGSQNLYTFSSFDDVCFYIVFLLFFILVYLHCDAALRCLFFVYGCSL